MAQAALTYIKEHMGEWGLDPKALAKMDLHIHVPEGAIPKDGPSAGVTMAAAILSTFTGRAIPRDMAFSGEITSAARFSPWAACEKNSSRPSATASAPSSSPRETGTSGANFPRRS